MTKTTTVPSPPTGLSSGKCMGSINRRNTLTSQGSNALFRLSNCPIVFNRRFCTRREPTCICISRVGAGLVVARDGCQFPVNIVEERHVMLTQSISTAPLTMLKRSVYGLTDHTTKWLPRSISRCRGSDRLMAARGATYHHLSCDSEGEAVPAAHAPRL